MANPFHDPASATVQNLEAAFAGESMAHIKYRYFAKLCREIGRLATTDDLKFKARNDSTFPSEKSFRRFETKEKLVGQFVAFYREKGKACFRLFRVT